MSRYTTEIRFICETLAGKKKSTGYNDIDTVITAAAPLIFSFDYPIFDTTYKLPLEKKILKHYYTREIGYETYGLWKLKLDDRMNMLMPLYNQLYKSALIEFDPINDVNLTRQHLMHNNGEQNNNTTFTGNTTINNDRTLTHDYEENLLQLYSDTPQGGIDGMDIRNGGMNYLTNATKNSNNNNYTDTDREDQTNTANNKTVGNNTVQNTEDYIETVIGKQGSSSFSALIKEFRETFLNIDKMLIDELSDLFIGLWF